MQPSYLAGSDGCGSLLVGKNVLLIFLLNNFLLHTASYLVFYFLYYTYPYTTDFLLYLHYRFPFFYSFRGI